MIWGLVEEIEEEHLREINRRKTWKVDSIILSCTVFIKAVDRDKEFEDLHDSYVNDHSSYDSRKMARAALGGESHPKAMFYKNNTGRFVMMEKIRDGIERALAEWKNWMAEEFREINEKLDRIEGHIDAINSILGRTVGK